MVIRFPRPRSLPGRWTPMATDPRAEERYVQVGWWDKDRGFMHALHYSTAKSGLTPLYERQWPLDVADHEPDNPQGVWCCDSHRDAYDAERAARSRPLGAKSVD